MNLTAALIYWVIIVLWLTVLVTVGAAYHKNPRTFGTARLLLAVLAIDAVRNIAENLYFGLYFGGQYGIFPAAIVGVLGKPQYLIIPKILNVFAAVAVLGLLILRWLPLAAGERRKADDQLKVQADALSLEYQERKTLFETSLDLILITDRYGVFTQVSPSSLATIGYGPDEMVGRSGIDFILPEDLNATRQEMQMARHGHQSRHFEARYIHKDGHVVPLAWSGVWSAPEQKHFFFGRDMSQQKFAEEKLRRLAHFDQLTGLANRTSLHEDIAELLSNSPRASLAIAAFDLDGFKDINDTLGHSTGDRLLHEVAKRMNGRETRLYRLGGDEFVLLMPDCGNPIVAGERVAVLLQELGAPFEIDGHRLFIAASAGIAISPNDGTEQDTLLASGDLALYEAKAAGGGQYRFFTPSLRARANARRMLDVDIRRGWERKEFVLFFQPQISAEGCLIGAEALIRWQHPEKGLLTPGSFIDALSDSAVVLEVGRWIIEEACNVASAWRARGFPHLRIGVNLFSAQFRHGSLLNDVTAALANSGLPADALELEITENIGLSNSSDVVSTLTSLRERGVGIALDDFGTGFASLNYLTRFPLTKIKIDRSFVQGIRDATASQDTAVVQSIITMAHNLGLKVNAEGVETSAQLAFLQNRGCDELQGYFFAQPLSKTAFERFMSARPESDREASRLFAG